MLCVLLAMVEQTLCNARLGRKCRFGQGLMIRQRIGRTAQTCLRPAHDNARIFPTCRGIEHFHPRVVVGGFRAPIPLSARRQPDSHRTVRDDGRPGECRSGESRRMGGVLTSGLYRGEWVRSGPMPSGGFAVRGVVERAAPVVRRVLAVHGTLLPSATMGGLAAGRESAGLAGHAAQPGAGVLGWLPVPPGSCAGGQEVASSAWSAKASASTPSANSAASASRAASASFTARMATPAG